MPRLPKLCTLGNVAVVLALPLLFQPAPVHADEPAVVVSQSNSAEGAIVQRDPNSIVLAAEGGDVAVRISQNAEIVVDGIPSTIDALRVGQFAVVTLRWVGDERIAMHVTAGWR
jgi:hypothetical protein